MRKSLHTKNVFIRPKSCRRSAQTIQAPSSGRRLAGPYSRRGIPDICAIIHGRFFALEVKRPDIGRLSNIQAQTIREIQRAGGIAAVVSYPEQALAIIQNALSNPPEKSQT